MAGVDLTHIPYRGSTPAVTDLVAGQVQMMFDVTPTSLPQIKAGKLRPLGVTTTERLPFLPDVPTIDSFLKGYEAAGWIGFGVPKGTPSEIIATLNKQTNAAVLDPNIKQRFADLGAVAVLPNSPDEFAKFIAENIDKWTKVISWRASSRSDLGYVPTFHNVSFPADQVRAGTQANEDNRAGVLVPSQFFYLCWIDSEHGRIPFFGRHPRTSSAR
jgi:hypothetical protein